MWKRAKPIVSETPIDQEVWWHEFCREFHELCYGAVDSEWLAAICQTIYPLARGQEPRATAKLIFTAFMFEMPEFVEAEHAARAHDQRLTAVGRWMARCAGPWRPR
ncbi:hypothetical protein SAMN05518800_3254 [Variovorax sp. YR752]|uniref:hypothetical protein n=1 Tax=Variovorax sp. YR752 TaxID=1884383 RepID=UPI000BCE7F89|nr:hypothetical protein [Variovorax sp. YR752]SOD27689.1 hypothetical protein SAMN05518800_3254 [Variovorax sp. YR752]